MKALEIAQSPVVDPLAVLGLTGRAGGAADDGRSRAQRGEFTTATASAQPLAQAQAAMRRLGRQAQVGAQAQAQAQVPAGQGGTQFTGNPISLDFQGADLRAVLRSFAEISGLNMVIDPRVHGTVDVALRDVPWDQALDIILRANGSVTAWTARSSGLRRSTMLRCRRTGARAAHRGGAGRRRAADHADAPAQLLEGRGDRRAAEAGEHPVESRPGVRSTPARTR